MPLDDLPDLSSYAVKKPKVDGDPSVARVVDDELARLGWSDNARLSALGDIGRENSWNRDVIFKGHTDPNPKNKEYNRGIISWQKDRLKNLDKYLKKNKLYGRNDDDEIRGMVRFMDEEMASNDEWKDIHKKMRDPNISTYDASENLRKYIKYVPGGQFNSYDPKFRVKNNARWATRAQALGLGQLPDLSEFSVRGLPDLTQFSQLPDLTEFATETPVQPIKEIGQSNATPEAPSAFEAQLTVARDPKNMARSGVFFPNDGTNAALKYANGLDSNWALFPDKKHNGTHLINLAKAKKLKLRTPKEIQEFIDKNPNAFKTLGIAVEDVGNDTQGVAITAENNGVERASAVVRTPETAVEQINAYQKQFPDATIRPTTTDEIVQNRIATLGGTENVPPSTEPPMTVAGELISDPRQAGKTRISQAEQEKTQAALQARFAELRKTNPSLTVDQFNKILSDEHKVKVEKSKQEWLAKNPALAKFAKEKNLDPFAQETVNEYNASRKKYSATKSTAKTQFDEASFNQANKFLREQGQPELSREEFIARQEGNSKVGISLDPNTFTVDGTKITDYEIEAPAQGGGTIRFPREVGKGRDANGTVAVYRSEKGMSEEDAYRAALLNAGSRYGITPEQVNAQIDKLKSAGKKFFQSGKHIAGNMIAVTWDDLANAGVDVNRERRMEQSQNTLVPAVDVGGPQLVTAPGGTRYAVANKDTELPTLGEFVDQILGDRDQQNNLTEQRKKELEYRVGETQEESEAAEFRANVLKSALANNFSLGESEVITGFGLTAASYLSWLGAGGADLTDKIDPFGVLSGSIVTNALFGKSRGDFLGKFGNKVQKLNELSTPDNSVYKIYREVGNVAGALPAYAAVGVAVGGNPVLTFAITDALVAKGKGGSLRDTIGAGAKGAVMGAMIGNLSRFGTMAADGLLGESLLKVVPKVKWEKSIDPSVRRAISRIWQADAIVQGGGSEAIAAKKLIERELAKSGLTLEQVLAAKPGGVTGAEATAAANEAAKKLTANTADGITTEIDRVAGRKIARGIIEYGVPIGLATGIGYGVSAIEGGSTQDNLKNALLFGAMQALGSIFHKKKGEKLTPDEVNKADGTVVRVPDEKGKPHDLILLKENNELTVTDVTGKVPPEAIQGAVLPKPPTPAPTDGETLLGSTEIDAKDKSDATNVKMDFEAPAEPTTPKENIEVSSQPASLEANPLVQDQTVESTVVPKTKKTVTKPVTDEVAETATEEVVEPPKKDKFSKQPLEEVKAEGEVKYDGVDDFFVDEEKPAEKVKVNEFKVEPFKGKDVKTDVVEQSDAVDAPSDSVEAQQLAEYKQQQEELRKTDDGIKSFVQKNKDRSFSAPLQGELKGKSVILHPSTRGEGLWQASFLDKDGEPFRDTVFSSYKQAVDEIVRQYNADLSSANVHPSPTNDAQTNEPKSFVPQTANTTTRYNVGAQDTFKLDHKSGASVTGYLKNADMPNGPSLPTRGELFYAETPANEQRKGIATSLAKDALRLMQLNGATTVTMNGTTEAGRKLIQKLQTESWLGDPIQTSTTGKTEYPIQGGMKNTPSDSVEVGKGDAPAQLSAKEQAKALRDLGYTLPVQRTLSDVQKADIIAKSIKKQDYVATQADGIAKGTKSGESESVETDWASIVKRYTHSKSLDSRDVQILNKLVKQLPKKDFNVATPQNSGSGYYVRTIKYLGDGKYTDGSNESNSPAELAVFMKMNAMAPTSESVGFKEHKGRYNDPHTGADKDWYSLYFPEQLRTTKSDVEATPSNRDADVQVAEKKANATVRATKAIAVPRSAAKRYSYADEVADQINTPEFKKLEAQSATEVPSRRTGFTKTQTEWITKSLQDYAKAYPEDAKYAGKSQTPYKEDSFKTEQIKPDTIAIPDDGVVRITDMQQANRLHLKLTGNPLKANLPKEIARISGDNSTKWEADTRRAPKGKPSNSRMAELQAEQDRFNDELTLNPDVEADLFASPEPQTYEESPEVIAELRKQAKEATDEQLRTILAKPNIGFTRQRLVEVELKKRENAKFPNTKSNTSDLAKGITVYSKGGAEGEVLKVNGDKVVVQWTNKDGEMAGDPVSVDADKVFTKAPSISPKAKSETQTKGAVKVGDTVENIIGGWKGTIAKNADGDLVVKRGKEVWGDYSPANYVPVESDVKSSDNPLRSIFPNAHPDEIAAVEAAGVEVGNNFDPAEDSILRSINASVEPFYSQLERTIEQKMPERASADQVRGIIKDTKTEEREWLGIDEWLNDHPKVTKAEVLDFIKENQVKVEEVVKGSPDSIPTLQWSDVDADADGLTFDRDSYFDYDDADGAVTSRWESEDFSSGNFSIIRDINDLYYVFDGRGNEAMAPGGTAYQSLDDAKTAANKLASDEYNENDTKFSQWVLPGGKNYKELLLTMPRKGAVSSKKRYEQLMNIADRRDLTDAEQREVEAIERAEFNGESVTGGEDFRSRHFAEPNILAHIRFDDRMVDGKKVLHIAEIQSDWHQAGRKNGYNVPYTGKTLPVVDRPDPYAVEKEDAIESYAVELPDGTLRGHFLTREIAEKHAEKITQELRDGKIKTGDVLNAPFKKSWHELALKKALRYAVENGYDAVSWDTGATQIDRYEEELRKNVDEIHYEKNDDGTWNLNAVKDGKSVVDKEDLTDDELEELIGKDMFSKVQEGVGNPLPDAPYRDWMVLKGDNLAIGGEGMKGFYDKILPSFANKYTKKWGGKVDAGEIENGSMNTNNPERELVPSTTPVHRLDITPEMRDSVMQGQPLFKIRSSEDVDALYNVLPYIQNTGDLLEYANGGTITDGELELSPYDAEVTRRLLAEVQKGTDVPASEGAVYNASTLNKMAKVAEAKSAEMTEMGYPKSYTDNLDNLAKNLRTIASNAKHGILYTFDESLPEERFHLEDLSAGRTSKEAIEQMKQSPLWDASEKFNRDYGKLSDRDKASEIVAKLATGQEKAYGWDKIDNFEAERAKLFDTWIDGIIAQNNITNIEAFNKEFTRLGAVYAEAKTNKDRTNKEGVNGNTGVQGGTSEGTNETRGQSEKGNGVQDRAVQEEGEIKFTPGGKEKESEAPKTLQKRGFPVKERIYTSTTNAERTEFANKQLDKGVDEAKKWAESQLDDENYNAGATGVVGINVLIQLGKEKRMDEFNKFADKLMPAYTDAGQMVQSLAIVSIFSPETAPVYLAKMAKKNGKTVTQEQLDKATDLAERMSESSQAMGVTEAAYEAEKQFNELLKKEIDELEKALDIARSEGEELAKKNKELRTQLAGKGRKIASLERKLEGSLPKTRLAGEVAKKVKEIDARKDDILARLAAKFGENAVLRMITGGDNALRSSNPPIDQDVKDWATWYLGNNIGKITVQQFKDALNTITNGAFSADELARIHADAVNELRVKHTPMDAERRVATALRNSHYREADRLNEKPYDVFGQDVPKPARRFANAVVTHGIRNGFTPQEIWFTIARKAHPKVSDALKAFRAEFPEVTREEERQVIKRSQTLTNDVKAELDSATIQKKSEDRLSQEDIDLIKNERSALRNAQMKISSEANTFYNSLVKSKTQVIIETLVNARRANLLTAVKTHFVNIGGNVGFGISEELSRVPSTMIDTLAGVFTGERTTTFAPKGIISGFKSLIKQDETLANAKWDTPDGRSSGLNAAKHIWAHGGSLEDLERLQHAESALSATFKGTLPKAIDFYVNKTFRALGAEDALFKVYAFRRHIEEQARAIALTEHKTDKSVNVKERTAELVANPTNVMQVLADQYAHFMTFQNDNIISTKIAGIKRSIGYGGKAAIETIMPYDRTPTNIVLRTLEYTPAGYAIGGAKFIIGKRRGISSQFRNDMTGAAMTDVAQDFASLPDTEKRQLVEAMLNRVYSRSQQEQFAKTMGRASVGTGLFTLGFVLAAAGLMAGSMSPDDDDRKETNEFFRRMQLGVDNGSLAIPGVGRITLPKSPATVAMTAGATLYEQMVMSKKSPTLAAIDASNEAFWDLASEQPLINSTSNLMRTFSKGKFGEFTGNLLSGFVPASAMVRSISEVGDAKARTGSGYKKGEKIVTFEDSMRQQQRGFKNSFLRGIPVARNYFVDESTAAVSDAERGGAMRRFIRQIDPFNFRSKKDKYVPPKAR